MKLRIGIAGPSGTGKSTLANFLSEKFDLPINPIGSRSVAKAMGFENPYDVDKAGVRAEFQRRLAEEKIAWEAEHEEFVTDRTTYDNLAYTILHDVRSIDAELLEKIINGAGRYTHILHCPVVAFCKTGDDPARVHDMVYHRIYDDVLQGLMDRYIAPRQVLHHVFESNLERRKYSLGEYFAMVRHSF